MMYSTWPPARPSRPTSYRDDGQRHLPASSPAAAYWTVLERRSSEHRSARESFEAQLLALSHEEARMDAELRRTLSSIAVLTTASEHEQQHAQQQQQQSFPQRRAVRCCSPVPSPSAPSPSPLPPPSELEPEPEPKPLALVQRPDLGEPPTAAGAGAAAAMSSRVSTATGLRVWYLDPARSTQGLRPEMATVDGVYSPRRDLRPHSVLLPELVSLVVSRELSRGALLHIDGMPGWVPLDSVLGVEQETESGWIQLLQLETGLLRQALNVGLNNLVPTMTPVLLHVYHVTHSVLPRLFNRMVPSPSAGAYHAGIEVYDAVEWSFGRAPAGKSGVTCCSARQNPFHCYSHTVALGKISQSRYEVAQIVESMSEDARWQGPRYHLLRHNCVHFAESLVTRLGLTTRPFPKLSIL
jgi:hypothetical protein